MENAIDMYGKKYRWRAVMAVIKEKEWEVVMSSTSRRRRRRHRRHCRIQSPSRVCFFLGGEVNYAESTSMLMYSNA